MKQCRIYKENLTEDNSHKYKVREHLICKTCENARSQQKDLKCKIDTIEIYGGKCVCCEESNIIFLTIDHVLEDGAEERRDINKSGGPKFYRWLKKQGYPKDNYQVLCFNCNFAKHVLGVCPHQANKLI